MLIKKLYIKEFGALKEKELYLGGGINLVEGDNESGKSTILAFIRFLFYGTSRRASGETISDKERYVSWHSGIAEGSMEIATTDGSYRIERKLVRHSTGGRESYSETCRTIDLGSGTEVYRGEVPGKIFLGITPEVYTSTSCIRQLESTNLSGGDVNTAIENLLFSADEEIDTEKIRTKLDDYRRTLLYKNEKGGKLFDLEAQKRLLEEKLTIAKRDSETVIAKEAIVKKMKEVSEKTKTEIEGYERQLQVYETCTILSRFDTLHGYEKKRDGFASELASLTEQKGYDGKLPDRDTLSALDRHGRTLAEKIAGEAHAAELLKAAKEASEGDRTLASYDRVIADEGGQAVILEKAKAFLSKKKRSVICAVLVWVFGILSLAASVIMYFTELLGNIPYLNYGLFGIGMICLMLGIVFTVSGTKATKRRRALLKKIGMSDHADIAHYMSTCENARIACEKYDLRLAEASGAHEKATDELLDAVFAAREFLASVAQETDEQDPVALVTLMQSVYTNFSAICDEKERLDGEIRGFGQLVSELQHELREENESELAASIGNRPISEVMNSMDITKLRTAYNVTRSQHEVAELKRIAVEKELIALTSVSESPARLASKLYALEKELAATRAQYEAIKLAHEQLGIAADNLRGSVTPSLRVRASELMNKITEGKYSELGVSTDMDITVVADDATRHIDALSKGTKDAAYISLRIALCELICGNDAPPIIFDESFTQMDETRTEKMLNMLFDLGLDGKQFILLTCHSREGQMLKKLGTFHHIKL